MGTPLAEVNYFIFIYFGTEARTMVAAAAAAAAAAAGEAVTEVMLPSPSKVGARGEL